MSAKARPLRDRFLEKFEALSEDECWPWLGTSQFGYGLLWVAGDTQKNVRAHRVSYEHFVGPIPDGLVIDHLCRNRLCVNPAHLEVVTSVENVLRGIGRTARNARKTHCKHGHEFTPENTYRWPRKPNGRMCRECMRQRCRASQARSAA